MKPRLEALARTAARRPLAALATILILAVAGGLLALSLEPSTGLDTFVSKSSSTYQATDQDHQRFGGDAIVILVREPLSNLVLSKDLATISFLEACLAGQYVVPSQELQSFSPAPAGAHAPYGGYNSPCGKLAKAKPVQVVYGPGTFLNQAVAAVNLGIRATLASAQQQVAQAGQAAQALAQAKGLTKAQVAQAVRSAKTLASAQQTQALERLYLNSGITGTPRIDDQSFISQIVFDHSRGPYVPKSRLSYLFPTQGAALIQVRLKPNLSTAAQTQAIGWIRQAVKMPLFRTQFGGVYTVSGAPVVLNDLAAQITGSISGLLLAAVVVMAIVLLLVFRRRLRLLPLIIALASCGIAFGVMAAVGGTLTMASIAVLPVLIGLAVDYAIQFQSRVLELRREGGDVREAVAAAAAAGAPAIAVAALATATGFLVLLLSPVPMVRGFGLLLVVGIVVAFVCAVSAVAAALVLADRDPAHEDGGARVGWRRRGGRCRGRLDPRRRRADRRPRPGVPRSRRTAPLRCPCPPPRSGRGRCGPPPGARQPSRRPGARRRCGARAPRPRARHGLGRRVRRDEARAHRHAGAARSADAGAGHRRLGGDRRARPGPQRRHPRRRQLDGQVRERARHAFRLPRDQGLPGEPAVPGAVAPRAVRQRQRRDPVRRERAGPDRLAAALGPAVLL